LIIGWLVIYGLEQRKAWQGLKMRKPILVLAGLLVFQLPIVITGGSFFGNTFRFQGWFLTALMVGYVLAKNGKDEKDQKMGFFPLIFLTVLIAGALLTGSNAAGRMTGTIGEPNMLAAAAIFAWPWLLKTNQKLGLLGLALTIILVIMTASRSAVVALGLQLLLLGGDGLFKKLKVAVILTAVVYTASLILPFTARSRIWESRQEIWQTAWVAGLTRPFWGWGFGGIEDALEQTAQTEKNSLRYMYVDSAHNIWLDWWIQGGIPGVIILAWIVMGVAEKMIKRRQTEELVVGMGLLAVMSFNPASIVTLVQWWWLVRRWNSV
jgi:O-antigen ligase